MGDFVKCCQISSKIDGFYDLAHVFGQKWNTLYLDITEMKISYNVTEFCIIMKSCQP